MRRIISFVLAFVMVFSVFPAQAFAEETAPEPQVDTSDVTIQGTNGFGNLLSEAIAEEQEETASEYEAGYTVTDLEIVDNVATVTYDSMEEAILIVALYTEDGMQMLTSAKTIVTADATQTTVTFGNDMPEYFLASAYLVDTFDLSPLCEAYDTPMYTREMQELVASTIHDYDPELVLNLDEDETTNFAVYAETTKVIEYVEGVNVVASADDETLTYVIKNADEQFTTLAEGDVVAYAYGENEILIVKVASITVNGTTVTITGADLEIEEAFSAVKIEGGDTTENMIVDESAADAGVTFEGIHANSTPEQIAPQDTHKGTTFSHSAEFKIEHKLTDEENVELEVTGSLEFALELSLDFYISATRQFIEFKVTNSIKGAITVTGKLMAELTLCKAAFYPIPALDVAIEPVFKVEVSGEIEFSVSLTTTSGFSYESKKGFKSLKTKPKFDADVQAKCVIFIGLDLQPQVEVANGAIAELKLEMPIGFEFEITQAGNGGDRPTGKEESFHSCESCLDTKVNFKIELVSKLQFLRCKWLTLEAKVVDAKYTLGHLYYSLDANEFGFGFCPRRAYRLTVNVKYENKETEEKENVKDACVSVAEWAEKTNSKGTATFYLSRGIHTITVDAMDLTKSKTITMKEPRKLTITLASEEDGNILDSAVSGSLEDKGTIIASGYCGPDAVWELYSGGHLEISGIGYTYDHDYASPWYNYRDLITSAKVGEDIYEIGENLFAECVNLKEVSLPSTIYRIGSRAFYRCASLESITIPEDVTTIHEETFEGCISLMSVGLSENVSEIKYGAFFGCGSLTSLVLLNGAISLKNDAFGNCDGLTSVAFPNGAGFLENGAFSDCDNIREVYISDLADWCAIQFDGSEANPLSLGAALYLKGEPLTELNIPEGVETIGDFAFYGYSSVTNVNLPSSLDRIGMYTFSDCTGLTSISIPQGTTEIGSGAFSDCTNLADISIADTVTRLGGYAFKNCPIQEIDLPESLTELGWSVFENCTNLESVDIPQSVTSIGTAAFYGCTALTEMTIPEGVTNLQSSVFSGCTNLKRVTLPESLTSIGNQAFYQCGSLEKLHVPENVTSIGDEAFDNCRALTEITLPSYANYLGEGAFCWCTSLRSVVIPEGITTIEEDTFRGCSSLETLVIPNTVKNIYKYAISQCSSLKELVLPESLEFVSQYVFSYNTSLKKVVFQGDEPRWNMYIFNGVIATAYYPADRGWRLESKHLFGGTVTWIPYTLDENGDMIINEAAAVTVEAELTEIPVEEVETMESGLEAPSQDFGEKDETLNPDAVYGGEYSTEITDIYTLKTASFKGLVPGERYVLLALKSIEGEDPLTADNLLFIDQAAALEDGTLVFTYVQRESTAMAYVVACGASNKNLKDAEITFPEMTADGELQVVDPAVVYDGKTLVEGRDYTITGTVSFTEAGTYTCYIRGVHNYTGLVECTYTVEQEEEYITQWISATTSLNGTIDLNIYVALSDNILNDPNAFVRFIRNGEIVDVPVSEGIEAEKRGQICYRYSCEIFAKQVADTVTIQVMNSKGAISNALEYSVMKYCVNQIKNSKDAELVKLCKALLNYATAAQVYFNHNINNLANASLSEADKALPNVDASAYKFNVVGSEPGIKPRSATLMLESEVAIRVYFILEDGYDISDFTFTIDGKQAEVQQNEKGYYIESEGIAAKELDDMHQFTVGSLTVNYGALSYVNSKAGGSNINEANLAKALYAYYTAAEALLG